MDLLTAVSLAISAVGGVIAGFLGGFDALLQSLILLMVLDICSGVWLSVHYHNSAKSPSGKFSSTALRHGIGNKILILFVVMISVVIDTVAGIDVLRDVAVLFYVVEESVSILENIALMGVPLPQKLIDVLDILTEESHGKFSEPEKLSIKDGAKGLFEIGNDNKDTVIKPKKR